MSRTKWLPDEANVLLEIHMRELGIEFIKEFKFHSTREWRFDYLLLLPRLGDQIAVEIEGGIHTQGRHVRGVGYAKDLVKYREAAALGFRVYRFSTEEVLNGTAHAFLQEHCGCLNVTRNHPQRSSATLR